MHAGRWLVAFSIIASTWGCGGDDAETKSSSVGAADGTAGTPADGAAGGTSVTPCGGKLCEPFQGPGLMLPLEACCVDQFAKTCGVQLGSACQVPPPSHPTCASLDTGFGPVFFGCCVANKCGLIDSLSGTNTCRDIESWQALLDMMGRGGLIPLPPAMSCD